MAHVVIIDEDEKVRREVIRFLKEMDITDIEEFPTSLEFERAYFLSLVPKANGAAAKNPLTELAPELSKFFNDTEFCPDTPFSDGSVQLELNKENLQILRVGVAKILGKTVPELVAKNVTLDQFCVTEFKGNLTRSIESGKVGQKNPQLVALQNEKGQTWAIEVTAEPSTSTSSGLRVTLKDLTKEIMKAVGKIKAEAEKKEDSKKPVDLIFFGVHSIKDKELKKWLTKVSALLKRLELWPGNFRPRFIALRHESETKEKYEYHHAFVDDLICHPFDRLIFLQKTELVLALPKKTSPTFLFVQEADSHIEVSKRILIERLNELVFGISNPVPLLPGTPGHFYFRFPGQKDLLSIYAKVTHSTPHPDRPEEFLVYFTPFGMDRNTLKEFRSYFARDPGFKLFADNDPKHFEYNPDNIFLEEKQKYRKTVAIIDYDENSVKSIADYLRKEIGNLDVVSDDTYYGIFKRYLDPKLGDKVSQARSDDFFADVVSFIVNFSDLNLQMALTPPAEGALLLEFDANKVFAEPQGWMNLFQVGDTKNLLQECLHIISSSKRIIKNFELMNARGERKLCNVEFVLEDNGNVIRINLKPPDIKTSTVKQLEKIESLELLIIDSAALPEDINFFMNSVNEAARAANIRVPEHGVQLIVIESDSKKVALDKIIHSKAIGLFQRPIEVRRFLFLATVATNSPFSIYNSANLNLKSDKILAKIARDAQLVVLGEFGCSFKSDQQLKPGTLLYLFGDIFKNAPDSNLCVRVYHSVEVSEEKGKFINSVVYFGITDAFLKFTRSYIRETYAIKKSKQ